MASARGLAQMRVGMNEEAVENVNNGWLEKMQGLRKGKAHAEAMQEQLKTELREAIQKISELEMEAMSLRRELKESNLGETNNRRLFC